MTIIKRYPNRKLYDTAARRYVSLDDIAAMIRRGDEVRVADHATGDDLTSIILAQVIVEQAKQPGESLPQSVLAGLVQAGGLTLAGLRRALTAPLDLLQHADEEIERRIDRLVRLGELAEDEAAQILQKLLVRPAPLDEALARQLRAHGAPTPSEWAALIEAVDRLSAEIDELAERRGQAPTAG